jgi:hypothetical protein
MADEDCCTFFPRPGEVARFIHAQKPPHSTRIDYTKPPKCEKCNDLGFVYLPQGQSKETKVERCQCKRRSA